MKQEANGGIQSTVQNSQSPGHVLALNAGSSSLKFAVFTAGTSPARVVSGDIDRIGTADATFVLKEHGHRTQKKISARDHSAALEHVITRLAESQFKGVGHRVVHGGPKYREPQMVDDGMLVELRRVGPFDPEHLPAEIALIEMLSAKFPGLPQVACFDTAFHRTLPSVARLLPIPRRYEARGVQRYGFHGLSYTFLMEELARVAGSNAAQGRVILAHLGNGASMAAVKAGQSVDTTMAFTPTAGLPMSTRSGDLDPGLAAYLERVEGMTTREFFKMANHESGLLGISETSSDMRDLLAREIEDSRAAEAVALFCYQASKWIGAFTVALDGLDTLVFSGGIGENAAPIRARICERLKVLGIQLDPKRNAASADVISSDESKVVVRVIRTDEELMIARSVCQVLERLQL
ncbi:MAG TPA: acetate/propionate family kinase [Candidatus Angelobacter sp.]|nr:acetate/propionate family kinase [Candidatus Angelobacter sp.]